MEIDWKELERVKHLIQLEIDLEGKLSTKEGVAVEAYPIGNPVILYLGWEVRHAGVPGDANAFVRGYPYCGAGNIESNRDLIPVQYYKTLEGD